MQKNTEWLHLEAVGHLPISIAHKGDVEYEAKGGVQVVKYGYAYVDKRLVGANDILEMLLLNQNFKTIYNQISGQFWMLVIETSGQITLVNDAVGVHNCFYTMTNERLYLSTSLRSLKSHDDINVSVSHQALYNYIYFHCIPSPTTIYQNVFKLEPGNAVLFTADGTQETDLFYCPTFAPRLADTLEAQKTCLEVIERCVERSVTKDVGAFLSGGLDSSAVSGMLSRHSAPAKTFSIGFEVAGYDETEYALCTSKHFGTEHKVLYLKPDEAEQKFVEIAQYFEEPFGNSSAMAAYFCAIFAKENGVKLLLAGDGGDELFAGNERYAKQKIFEIYQKLPSPLGNAVNAIFNNQATRVIPGVKKVASYLQQARVTLPGRLQSYNFVNQMGVGAIFSQALLNNVDESVPIAQLEKRYQQCESQHPVDKMLFLDWKNTLADNDLIKVTKMCELAGVEVRFPLLDKQLVDFSCTVPADVKLPNLKLRDFFKQACKGFLADDTLSKEKHGFGLPFGAWMKDYEPLRVLTETTLNEFKKRNIVSDSLIDTALNAHKSLHTGYYGELIWIIVVLELWLQAEEPEYSVTA